MAKVALTWLKHVVNTCAIWFEDNFVFPPPVTRKAKIAYKFWNAEVRKRGDEARAEWAVWENENSTEGPDYGEPFYWERKSPAQIRARKARKKAKAAKKKAKKDKKKAMKEMKKAMKAKKMTTSEDQKPLTTNKDQKSVTTNKDQKSVSPVNQEVSHSGVAVGRAKRVVPKMSFRHFYPNLNGGGFIIGEVEDNEDDIGGAEAVAFPAVPDAEPMNSKQTVKSGEQIQDMEILNGEEVTCPKKVVTREPVLA